MALVGTISSLLIASGLVGVGVWEKRRHAAALACIPLRIHVNGTRGKTSVTHQIATVFRLAGQSVVAKSTGTLPELITPDGSKQLWPRRGRARIQEQIAVLRYANKVGASVCVLECMALQPEYQWLSEHRIVKSHIGVITNVRRDHFEEMGNSLDDIARSLANTIPKSGHLVTGDARYAPLFADIARQRGTEVHLAVPGDAGDTSAMAKNWAITRRVAAIAGVPERYVDAARQALPLTPLPAVPLPHPASRLVHVGAINDPDSFASFVAQYKTDEPLLVPLYNHRRDRPWRARLFGDLFAARASEFPLVLVTGHPGAIRIFRRCGVSPQRLGRVSLPLDPAAVASALAPLSAPCTVLLCGNAQGVPEWDTAGPRGVGWQGPRPNVQF